MYIYIDESGDCGMKGKAGSSSMYIVTAIVFQTRVDRNHCSSRLRRLRMKLRRPPTSEFRFSKLAHRNLSQVFHEISSCKFRYFTVVVDKRKLDGMGFTYWRSFRKYPIKLLVSNMASHLKNATLILDKFGKKDFQIQLKNYIHELSNELSAPVFKRIQMRNSHQSISLQVADLVCGAIAKNVEGSEPDHQKFRVMIQDKESGLQKWPTRWR